MKNFRALEILKNYSFLCSQKFIQSGDECFKKEYIEANEAISELEALQSRSCEGCKHGKYGADSRGIEVECTLIWHCARGNCFPDRYEKKKK